MITAPDGNLHVYMLSVGQGDTTIVISPEGKVLIIDAMRPGKIINFLNNLQNDGKIEHLVITHPHDDHFSGANRLASDLTVLEATIAPFWHEFGMGPQTYRQLVARLDSKGADISFLSGYNRWYPDNIMTVPLPGEYPQVDPDKPYLELLGPTNGLIRMLEDANTFETNHLSIMSRLRWKNFCMVISGDAQMENWAFFDQERLLEDKCQVMRSAHHGSKNGTQWERLERLGPTVIIISSDPAAKDLLPDLCGAAIFTKFDSTEGKMAAITSYTGSIHLKVTSGGTRTMEMYGDSPTGDINLNNAKPLTEISNPTDWRSLLQSRVTTL